MLTQFACARIRTNISCITTRNKLTPFPLSLFGRERIEYRRWTNTCNGGPDARFTGSLLLCCGHLATSEGNLRLSESNRMNVATSINPGDTAWVLVATALVMMMTPA